MDASIHGSGDFVNYPTNRVVGTIADATQARAAIEALLHAGVEREAIDVLHGEKGLHRLDVSGVEHGFLAQFQRTMIRLAGPAEEYAHLRHHVEDVRAGRFVIMVLANDQDRRDLVARILNAHSAEFIGFYGTWAWTSMSGSGLELPAPPHGESDSREFETAVDGIVFRLRFDFQNKIVDAVVTHPDGRVRHTTGVLKPIV
jgi:hypothetical protein